MADVAFGSGGKRGTSAAAAEVTRNTCRRTCTCPVGRRSIPEEIARCVVFLAADESGFIEGSTISANGGQFIT